MTIAHPQSIAVLAGNGLSISYNDKLVIPRITKEITDRLDEAGNSLDPAAQLMQQVARRAGADNADTNFEALVGPFDEFRDGLRMIRRLASIAGERQLAIERSLLDSANFADEVRRHAVSHILDVIARESVSHWSDMTALHGFVDAIVSASGGGEITFGNLNYDSLLMAALTNLHIDKLCDLTDGRSVYPNIEVVPGVLMRGQALRSRADLPPNRRIALLHLHGSLSWLRHTETGTYMRFPIAELRASDYWTKWREGLTKWAPVVVLTNQNSKGELVQGYPFNLAYETFFSRLLTADKWLIAGTSLTDDCVNALLRKAWRMRATVPHVLVVTNGNWPSQNDILDAIGYDPIWNNDPDPRQWLSVHREGIETAHDSFDWMLWAAEFTRPLTRVRAS